MPRVSKRVTYLQKLENRVRVLKKTNVASSSGDDDVLEPDNYLHALCMVACRKLQHMKTKRYLFRSRKHRKCKGECPYDKDFNDKGDLPWLNDSEFLMAYRMSRKSMRKLIDLMI